MPASSILIICILGFFACTSTVVHADFTCMGLCETPYEQCLKQVSRLEETYFVCMVERNKCVKRCERFRMVSNESEQ